MGTSQTLKSFDSALVQKKLCPQSKQGSNENILATLSWTPCLGVHMKYVHMFIGGTYEMFTYTMGPAVVVYRQSLWNTVTIYPCYSIIIHQSFCWTTVLGGLSQLLSGLRLQPQLQVGEVGLGSPTSCIPRTWMHYDADMIREHIIIV